MFTQPQDKKPPQHRVSHFPYSYLVFCLHSFIHSFHLTLPPVSYIYINPYPVPTCHRLVPCPRPFNTIYQHVKL